MAKSDSEEPFADIVLELSRAQAKVESAVSESDQAYARGYRDGVDYALGRLLDPAGSTAGAVDGPTALAELYESIVKSSPDVIAITNLKMEIFFVSQSVVKMFGWTGEELVGKPIIDFIVPQDHERARSRIDLMLQGILTGPGEYRGIRKQGSVFTIEVNAELIRDADNRPSKIVFIIRDSS